MNKKLTALLTACTMCAGTGIVPAMTATAATTDELKQAVLDTFDTLAIDGKVEVDGTTFTKDNGLIKVTMPATTIDGKEFTEVLVDTNIQAKRNVSTANYSDLIAGNSTTVSSRTKKSNFVLKVTLDMANVADVYNDYIQLAKNVIASGATGVTEGMLNNTKVKGEFVVNVDLPDGLRISDADMKKNNKDMNGFAFADGSDITALYSEVNRVYDEANETLTITISPDEGATGFVSKATLNSLVNKDLVLECEVEADAPASGNKKVYEAKGYVNGNTTICSGNGAEIGYVEYKSVQAADVKGNGENSQQDEVSAVDGDNIIVSEHVRVNYSTGSTGGGGGYVPSTTPTPAPTATATPEPGSTATPVPTDTPDGPDLNTVDHVAYIIGYPEGDVRPENNISRAEVATIFFRLLTDTSRTAYWRQSNDYSDVNSTDWFNNAVSTLSNANIITGYEDGTFNPNGYITRAEFATIAARFSKTTYEGDSKFADTVNHWARNFIDLAESLGWVAGYEDGTFKPDQYITRAEAMTLVNNVLNRHADADQMLDDMVKWSDNAESAWYYAAVQEATNSHSYTKHEDGFHGTWVEILEAPDWAALEREWSNAASVDTDDVIAE